MATFQEISEIIKETYLPAWENQIGVTPSAIMAKIKKVPLKGDEIVTAAPIGLNGGFGFGQDGSSIPVAGRRMKKKFKTESKDMFTEIQISDKVLKLAKGDVDSIINELDDEIKGAYEAAEWNVGRSIYGNGTGLLATISAVNAAVLTVDDTKFLKEGLQVDIIDSTSTADTPVVNTSAPLRIIAIDRVNKTVTLSATAASVAAQGDFIAVQQSAYRELTGLGAIMDDNITDLYGVTKSTSPFIKPITVSGATGISDTLLNNALRLADREKNSKIDFLCMGDEAYDAYITYLRMNNQYNVGTDMALEGGFKAIRYLFGNREVAVVNEQFVPNDEIWGVETGKLELHCTPWDFVNKDSGAFTLMSGTSIFRALLASYGDLICKNPGGLLRITDVTIPTVESAASAESGGSEGGAAAGGSEGGSGTTTG